MRQVSVCALVMLLSLALAAPGVSWAGGKVPRVDKDTLKSWLSDPQVIIVDVRIPSDWQESREKIKGALRKVPGQVKIWGPSLPKDKKIVVYCDWQHEATGARVALQLLQMGFPQVMALKGGWEEWQKAGYPTEPKK